MTSARTTAGVRRRWGLLVVLALFAGLGAVLVLKSRTGAFDAEQWQAQRGKDERDNPRAGMVGDLEKAHLRVGMSRAEVQRLLGEADQHRERSDVYELGMSPVAVDYQYFVVDYDNAGTLIGWHISDG